MKSFSPFPATVVTLLPLLALTSAQSSDDTIAVVNINIPVWTTIGAANPPYGYNVGPGAMPMEISQSYIKDKDHPFEFWYEVYEHNDNLDDKSWLEKPPYWMITCEVQVEDGYNAPSEFTFIDAPPYLLAASDGKARIFCPRDKMTCPNNKCDGAHALPTGDLDSHKL
ncbi:uncharacterized protein IL334_005727 [Kwoniella shivajii]|uniref:Uncharacterized protein n=1 Tax=Kwoniella shivajii TaxID=564305 RepID=A0ABZ1D584_9TREE|nr:hypothetical protein IL334_005727 [Kwoniella shivajii]